MTALTYNSNSNLKAAGVQIQFTQEQVQEYLKCKEDPVYFIKTYCKIVTLDHGLQPFDLYECQVKKINIIHENRKVILMEGRQQGKTTTSAAYIVWYTLFQANKNVAILANKATAAREVLNRYQTMYESLPKWLQQGVTTWNKGDVELENGSKVFTAATSASGIRGKSCVTGDTKVCIENDGSFFYVEIDKLNNSGINLEETDMSKKYAIYKTTNSINGKFYVGFHTTSEVGILRTEYGKGSCFSDGYLGSGKLLKRALELHKPEAFYQEILEVFDDKESAENLERTLVNEEFVKSEETYNLSIGGNVCILHGEANGFYGRKHTKETLNKIKASREQSNLPTYQRAFIDNQGKIYKGFDEILSAFKFTYPENTPNLGGRKRIFVSQLIHDEIVSSLDDPDYDKAMIDYYKDHVRCNSEEYKEEISNRLGSLCSERFKGKPKSEEHREKIGSRVSDWISNHPEEHRIRMFKVNKNPEKIAKTAAKHRGMKRSEGARRNISESLKGLPTHNVGKVSAINLETGKKSYFNSTQDVPEGWRLGSVGGARKGCKKFTNGEICKMYIHGEEPEGWFLKNAS